MTGCEHPWQEAFERAYAASEEFRAEEERKAGEVYRFEVGFTIPQTVARDAVIETHRVADGLRVEMEFHATEGARERITDVIADLPTTCRSFRRYYAETGGGEGHGGD